MNKIKKVVKLAKSLGSSFPLHENYTLIKVSSQLPPYTDLARGVSSLDHYEIRHPYSDDVIGSFTVWSAKRIPTIVKLGVFQEPHKSIGLIEALNDKIKEMYPNVPDDLLSYMYTIWGGVTANTLFHDGLHPASQLKFHEIFSALKRAPLRKSDGANKPFHDHLDYHVYQGNEHVGTLNGKELNAMMPTTDHRSQTEREQNFVFHATNTVTGDPASYMKKSTEQNDGWMVKLAGSDEYHPLVDIADNKQNVGQGGGNIYSIKRPDGSVTQHHQDEVEDLKHSKELAQSMPVFMRD